MPCPVEDLPLPLVSLDEEEGDDGVEYVHEDDEDHGKLIVYTGAGGRDDSGKHIADQSWENSGNAGLLVSMDQGRPVRVIRGHQHKSQFSPTTGYSYAGLYSVESAWEETGKSGFRVCWILHGP